MSLFISRHYNSDNQVFEILCNPDEQTVHDTDLKELSLFF